MAICLETLAKRRARRLATFEALAGWNNSLDSDERQLYSRARLSYEAADRKYQKAKDEANG